MNVKIPFTSLSLLSSSLWLPIFSALVVVLYSCNHLAFFISRRTIERLDQWPDWRHCCRYNCCQSGDLCFYPTPLYLGIVWLAALPFCRDFHHHGRVVWIDFREIKTWPTSGSILSGQSNTIRSGAFGFGAWHLTCGFIQADYFGGFSQQDLNELYSAITQDFSNWLNHFARLAMANADKPSMAQKLSESIQTIPQEQILTTVCAIFQSHYRDEVKKLDKRTLLIQTQDDVIVPLAVAEYLSSAIPDSQISIIPAQGHCRISVQQRKWLGPSQLFSIHSLILQIKAFITWQSQWSNLVRSTVNLPCLSANNYTY